MKKLGLAALAAAMLSCAYLPAKAQSVLPPEIVWVVTNDFTQTITQDATSEEVNLTNFNSLAPIPINPNGGTATASATVPSSVAFGSVQVGFFANSPFNHEVSCRWEISAGIVNANGTLFNNTIDATAIGSEANNEPNCEIMNNNPAPVQAADGHYVYTYQVHFHWGS